jgi:hypothetical protein
MGAGSSKDRILAEPEEPLTELQYFCKAADLLQRFFSELQFLSSRNPSLAYTMLDREPDTCFHLRTLLETINELLGVNDPSLTIPLRRRAVTLISWLSTEMDQLMARVARCEGYAVVGSSEWVLH